MQLLRMFSTDKYKGTRNYLDSQKKYELLRTIIYFAISLSLFAAGIIATGERTNLLTVVAILGCLPACKSAVGMIMFFRYKSCKGEDADRIESHMDSLQGLYDLVFTSYEKNYHVDHITVKGNTICGYTSDKDFKEQEFYKHIDGILKADNYRDTNVKIFKEIKKYTERLEQMKVLNTEKGVTEGILASLKSVAL